MAKSERRQYTQEFKRNIVNLVSAPRLMLCETEHHMLQNRFQRSATLAIT